MSYSTTCTRASIRAVQTKTMLSPLIIEKRKKSSSSFIIIRQKERREDDNCLISPFDLHDNERRGGKRRFWGSSLTHSPDPFRKKNSPAHLLIIADRLAPMNMGGGRIYVAERRRVYSGAHHGSTGCPTLGDKKITEKSFIDSRQFWHDRRRLFPIPHQSVAFLI